MSWKFEVFKTKLCLSQTEGSMNYIYPVCKFKSKKQAQKFIDTADNYGSASKFHKLFFEFNKKMVQNSMETIEYQMLLGSYTVYAFQSNKKIREFMLEMAKEWSGTPEELYETAKLLA